MDTNPSPTYVPLVSVDAQDGITTPRTVSKKKWSSAKRMVENNWFKACSLLCLVIALFGGGTVAQIDPPDDIANVPLDIVMTSISVFFVLEFVLRLIGEYKVYCCSFFFWMDIIGTASMAFEISYLLGEAGKIQETNSNMHAVAVRSARAARIGARAGRLSRPLRLLHTLLKNGELDTQEAGYSAKVLGQKLTQVFSSKVAMLTVVLVLGVPVFNIGRYPEDDFSMKSWGSKIEADYARDFHYATDGHEHSTSQFKASVSDMSTFYESVGDYFPYQLEGYPTSVTVHGKTVKIPEIDLFEHKVPVRKQNIMRQTVHRCKLLRPGCDGDDIAAVYFNFTASNQYDSLMDMAVTVFIVLCMMVESADLSFSVDRMMVKPMERMLDSARLMSKQLNQAMSRGKPGKMQEAAKAMGAELNLVNQTEDDEDEDDDDDEDGTQNEIEMLQALFKKVVFLINVFMEQDVAEQAEGMDDASCGVMTDIAMGGMDTIAKQQTLHRLKSQQSMAWGVGSQQMLQRGGTVTGGDIDFQAAASRLTSAPFKAPPSVALAVCNDDNSIMSWGHNMLTLDKEKRNAVVNEVLFTSDVGKLTGQVYIDPAVFKKFLEVVEATHQQNQYHTYTHACDVMAGCYRWMRQMHWSAWLIDLEATALLISALVADIGHPGRTNQFLVETSDPLAINYNDKSPLENMHCAKFFDICANSDTNVFSRLDKVKFKHVRAVCIEAILATDNAVHFDLVKDIKKIYGMASDMCDSQAQSPNHLATHYVTNVLQENVPLWRKVILHLADVSNPCLKFPVAKAWATLIMDEFFAQGDLEKEMGIPIGLLNDRDRVTVAGAQFGFNTMLLAPLIVSVIHIFPMVGTIARQTMNNVEAWLSDWEREPTFLAGKQREKMRKLEEQLGKFTTFQVSKRKSVKHKTNKPNASLVDMESAGTVNLAGAWVCIATWGLEEFLKSTGVSWARRKAAMGAPWPSWEFQQSGDHVVFVNNSAVGVLREEITANNQPFTIVDGWKQSVNCLSYWDNGALIIEKEGPQGKFREERRIDDNGLLQFSLQPIKPEGPKWGRSFEPKKKK